jgi:hypothetical protein
MPISEGEWNISSTNDNLMFLKRIFFLIQNQHEKRLCLGTVVNRENHHENRQPFLAGRQTMNNKLWTKNDELWTKSF